MLYCSDVADFTEKKRDLELGVQLVSVSISAGFIIHCDNKFPLIFGTISDIVSFCSDYNGFALVLKRKLAPGSRTQPRTENAPLMKVSAILSSESVIIRIYFVLN